MKDLVQKLNAHIKLLNSLGTLKETQELLDEAAKALEKTTIEEPEFRKNQDVIVSDYSEFRASLKRKYSHKEKGLHYCFNDGASSYNSIEGMETWWQYCKPDYDAPSFINWIPNTGVKPDIELKEGQFLLIGWSPPTNDVDVYSVDEWQSLDWSLNRHIKQYAILEV